MFDIHRLDDLPLSDCEDRLCHYERSKHYEERDYVPSSLALFPTSVMCTGSIRQETYEGCQCPRVSWRTYLDWVGEHRATYHILRPP